MQYYQQANPVIGKPGYTGFAQNYDNGQKGWIQYGGSWFVKDGEYVAGNVTASHLLNC